MGQQTGNPNSSLSQNVFTGSRDKEAGTTVLPATPWSLRLKVWGSDPSVTSSPTVNPPVPPAACLESVHAPTQPPTPSSSSRLLQHPGHSTPHHSPQRCPRPRLSGPSPSFLQGPQGPPPSLAAVSQQESRALHPTSPQVAPPLPCPSTVRSPEKAVTAPPPRALLSCQGARLPPQNRSLLLLPRPLQAASTTLHSAPSLGPQRCPRPSE